MFQIQKIRPMDRTELFEKTTSIKPADRQAVFKARERQASLAKPPGSLGGLEHMSVRIAGMTGRIINRIGRGCVVVFCADNGVAREGVASAPQSVTRAQTVNFTRRLTGVGALARSYDSELLIVDMGVKDPIPEGLYADTPLADTHKIVNRRLRTEGQTDNIAEGPAMTEEEALRAIETGIEMADAVCKEGFSIMGAGEMGIGNTTTSAALLSAITGKPAEDTAGRGGGVNDTGFARKKEIINQVSAPFREEGGVLAGPEELRAGRMIKALARMGGFDICAMAGAYLGAAMNRKPIVIDGYISAVAALAAYVIAPASVDYMIASHKSFEKGYSLAIEILGLKPFLSLDMRLGEGSGCPIAFSIIRGACDVMADMATFEEAKINDDYLEEIRSEEKYQR